MKPFSFRIELFFSLLLLMLTTNSYSQVISTNGNPVGLEHNLLFNATTRYTVTQTGQAQVDLNTLFDGVFGPTYSNTAVSSTDPTIITIEGFPANHTQRGAWVGWTTRWWPSSKFKIEGYLAWSVNNGGEHWVTITDQDNYPGFDFLVSLPEGAYSKLRFTFYIGTGTDGKFGLSELYYINTEATSIYGGLFETYGSTWLKNGDNLKYNQGNVSIGNIIQTETSGKYKLNVAGPIRVDEVTVNTTGADFVFEPTYKLRPLSEVETFINQNKHLPDVVPAAEMQINGVSMGDMQAKLLQKVEELTLYSIEQDKKMQEQSTQLQEQRQANASLEQQIAQQNNKLSQQDFQYQLLVKEVDELKKTFEEINQSSK